MPCDHSPRGGPRLGPGPGGRSRGRLPTLVASSGRAPGGGGSSGRRASTLWCALPAAVARPRGLSAAPPPRRLYRPRFRPRYFRPAARWGRFCRPRCLAARAGPPPPPPGPARTAPAASAPLAAAPPRSAAAPGAGSAGGGRRGAMGAYLSQPNTVKSSGDGAGLGPRPLHFGFSAMQGWRVSMEVSAGARGRGCCGGAVAAACPSPRGSLVLPRAGIAAETAPLCGSVGEVLRGPPRAGRWDAEPAKPRQGVRSWG